MTIYGEMGEVERIACTALPEAEIVNDGNLLPALLKLDSLGRFVPANCPRREEFDSTKTIGCIGCTNAFIDYTNGIADC